MKTRPLDPSEADVAIGVLARAFHDALGVGFLLPDPERRAALLPAFFAPIVAQGLHHGRIDTTIGAVRGVAVWTLPTAAHQDVTGPPTAAHEASTGSANAAHQGADRPPFAASWQADELARRARLDAFIGGAHARAAPEPHWYLAFLAVDPPHQGGGIGRDLIEPGIAAARHDGFHVILATANPRTLPFYDRSGFRVILEDQLAGENLRVWILRHD